MNAGRLRAGSREVGPYERASVLVRREPSAIEERPGDRYLYRQCTDEWESSTSQPDSEPDRDEDVRNDCPERRTDDTEVSHEDEDGAQHDVSDRTAGTEQHRRLGVVAADENAAPDEVQTGERDAEADDSEVRTPT